MIWPGGAIAIERITGEELGEGVKRDGADFGAHDEEGDGM